VGLLFKHKGSVSELACQRIKELAGLFSAMKRETQTTEGERQATDVETVQSQSMGVAIKRWVRGKYGNYRRRSGTRIHGVYSLG
jgi:hypothetical protein